MTPAFAAFIAAARRRPAIWRLLAGVVTALIVYVAWLGAMGAALWLTLGRLDAMQVLGRLVAAVDPAPMFLLLASFAGLALGPVVAARLWQRRGAGTLIGRAPAVVADFARATLVVGLVYAVLLMPWTGRFDAVRNLPLGLWLRLLPLALAGVALQTLAEEMVFRGYLMQQLAARFRSAWVWMLLPALAFGALHYDPRTNGANTWLVIGAVTLFGLIAADLTRRTGSLGASWGMHFGNNVVALLVLATDGALRGLALFVTPYRASDPAVIGAALGDIAALAAVWFILVRLLRR